MARWLKKLVAVGVVLALLISIAFAFDVARADWAYFRAEKSLAQFRAAGEQRDIKQLRKAKHAVNQALDIWPDNPKYLSLAAQVLVWEGYLIASATNSPDIERQHYEQAIALLRKALSLSPAHARTWALLAEYKVHLGQRDEEWHAARENALELGGSDPKLVERMLK